MQKGRTVLLAALLLAGCDFPRDAAGALDRIEAEGVMRVGIDRREPWVVVHDGRLEGIEPRLVTAWAETLGARVEWVEAATPSLVETLKAGRVDVVIAGLTDDAPWTREAGASEPFHEAAILIGAAPGSDAPSDAEGWKGRTVAYPAGRPDFAALLSEIGAVPQPVEDLSAAPAAVAYAFELADLGLSPTGVTLAREKHVMLAAPGENALLLSLDKFIAAARKSGTVTEGAP